METVQTDPPAEIPPKIMDALRRMKLLAAGATIRGEVLTGGVSSDIWRIDLPSGPVCVKRALAKLRVAADWQAPVDRNLYEARWMRRANAAVPGAAPALLGQDAASGSLAMQFLSPADHPLWKAQLRDGHADPGFAAAVADWLVRIHAATAADPGVAADFPTDAIFHAIRLEPYLLATARAHPDLAPQLEALVATTQANKRALVHGDVSPKNILTGPDGPVFLDAECAWWGDPAFDLAFCLNHLLLKCLWTPRAQYGFLACFDAMVAAYRAGVDWEAADAVEARVARLLPGLFLARVDGKSPVEYITAPADKDRVRRVARALLIAPPRRLDAVRQAWSRELAT
jgi:aminoglycoside phosphotransferase (APT) family kinase protein